MTAFLFPQIRQSGFENAERAKYIGIEYLVHFGSTDLFDGAYDSVFQIPDELAKVTPAQIQAFAAKYLVSSNRTIINRTPSQPDASGEKKQGGAQ